MATSAQPQPAFVLQRRLLRLREFDLMKEAGIFTEDDRVELLDGELLAMSTVGGQHIGCIVRCDRQLQRGSDPALLIGVQNPLRIGGRTEFMPHLLAYRGDETSNEVPLAEQVPRYAAAGIPEMIPVDLVADRISGYSEPREDGYRRILVAWRGEQLPSVILPNSVFDVDTILGPQ